MARASRPGSVAPGIGPRCCGTARTRTSRPPCTSTASAQGLAQAEQLHGKEMSYNNYVDADAAHRAAYDHGDAATVAIIKHANPCGIAVGADVAEAHRKAHACDPVSAFGGVIATNAVVTLEMAEAVAEIFTEVIVAPGYDADALAVLTAKKNVRLLVASAPVRGGVEMRPISGGLLMQQRDVIDARGGGRGRAIRPAMTRLAGVWCPASRPTRRRWRTWSSPGGRSGP